MNNQQKYQFVIVMGVSGSGKTSVGQSLATRLRWQFYDADAFHPTQNVEKMAQGIPLTDIDRYPWLKRLHDLIQEHLAAGKPGVLACSALKKQYRDLLREENSGLGFVYLHSDFKTIWQRMEARVGHYMKAEMLQSQFDILEEPDADEAFKLDGRQEIEPLVQQIIHWLT
jgi:gluconokinase